MTAIDSEKSPSPRVTGSSAASFRSDLEGLRAVAVLLVVLYHAGLPGIPGGYVGVDVFFVLSGFFITRQLLVGQEQTGRVDIFEFYVRRVRRLMPMTILVLSATMLVAFLIFPSPLLVETGWDALYSAWSVGNYRFALLATDYFASGTTPSPLLHFWSLAVEEQFYLFWPLIFVVSSAVLLRHKKTRSGQIRSSGRRGIIAFLVALVALASFAFSLWLTPENQPAAYFGLPTRAWELALGGLLALSAGHFLTLRRIVSPFLSLLGLLVVLASAVIFNDQTPYPGFAALVPTLGTAAVIFSRPSPTAKFLSLPPLRVVGRWSFSFYLWHWPILVFASAAALDGIVPLRIRLVLMAGALALSGVTYRYFENPLRLSPWFPKSRVGPFSAAIVLTLVVSLCAWQLTAIKATSATQSVSSLTAENVVALEQSFQQAAVVRPVPSNLTPSVEDAKNQAGTSSYGTKCMANFEETDFPSCVFGDPEGSYVIWLVGDSHANHWFSAVEEVAKKHHVKLVLHTRSGCPILDVEIAIGSNQGAPYTNCTDWTTKVMTGLAEAKPDLLIVSGTINITGFHLDSYGRSLRHLRLLAKSMLVLGDTPHSAVDIPECVAAHLADASHCNIRIGQAGAEDQHSDLVAQAKTLALDAGATYQDTRQWLCDGDQCPVIVGNVLLYRDQSHLTVAAAKLLTPFMEEALKPFLPPA